MEAVLHAFPTRGAFEQVISLMNENATAIVDPGGLRDQTFALLRWLEAKGRLDEYLRHAEAQNPFNLSLQDFIKHRKTCQCLHTEISRTVYERMLLLSPSQALTVIYESGMAPEHLPRGDWPERSLAMVRWAEQQGRLQTLDALISKHLP